MSGEWLTRTHDLTVCCVQPPIPVNSVRALSWLALYKENLFPQACAKIKS